MEADQGHSLDGTFLWSPATTVCQAMTSYLHHLRHSPQTMPAQQPAETHPSVPPIRMGSAETKQAQRFSPFSPFYVFLIIYLFVYLSICLSIA